MMHKTTQGDWGQSRVVGIIIDALSIGAWSGSRRSASFEQYCSRQELWGPRPRSGWATVRAWIFSDDPERALTHDPEGLDRNPTSAHYCSPRAPRWSRKALKHCAFTVRASWTNAQCVHFSLCRF